MRSLSILTIVLSLVLVASCSTGRYQMKQDTAPVRPPTALELQDAKVVHEPLTYHNSPYTVWGKSYTPMKERKPYTKVGIASWYGKKFHGHLTSNGEIYDMYAMSAAHKTLPLPSYVKVTNLKNDKSVIVRVNDRGPFHEDRIIDLSYSAAYKIGVYDTGTAEVKVEVILPSNETQAEASAFQVVIKGFKSQAEAVESQKGLELLLSQPVELVTLNKHPALVFGPYQQRKEAKAMQLKLGDFGFADASIELTQ